MNILNSIKSPDGDIHDFGMNIIGLIRQSEILHSPENNFDILKTFLKSYIKGLNAEIKHAKKYTPDVYHENVVKSRQYEIEVINTIIKSLKR